MSDNIAVIIGMLMALAVVALPVSCTAYSTYKKGEAIAAGANPIEADCAFSMAPNNTACAIAAAKLNVKKD